MKIIYNCLNINEFDIENFDVGKPLIIKKANLMLTVHRIFNIVYFFNKLNNLVEQQQQWVFEKSEIGDNYYYIKSNIEQEGGLKYLGSPNKNNIVYLYTSKNRHTLWKVKNLSGTRYEILYAGEKYDIKKHCMVVARYNECLNWLLPYEDITIVYNKGADDLPPFKNIIKLENVGREGHTYLYHIIREYDNLSERITFIQGDPATHNHTILYGLDNADKFGHFQPLGLRWLETKQIPPSKIVNKYKQKTEYGLEYLIINLNGDLNYKEPHDFYDEGIDFLVKKYKKDHRLPTNKFCIASHFLDRCKFPYSNINKKLDTIEFTFSALFSVVRTNIIIYERDVYKAISKELLSLHPQGGQQGYILERLWLYIFDNL